MILPYMNMIQLQQKYCLSLVYLLLYYFVSPYKNYQHFSYCTGELATVYIVYLVVSLFWQFGKARISVSCVSVYLRI